MSWKRQIAEHKAIAEESKAAKFAAWGSYWDFAHAVRRGHRFVWPPKVQEFLDAVARTAKKREFPIQEGESFYRAQIGWEHDIEELEDGTLVGPSAFGPERMKPVARLIPEGRANAAGIPVLYLAKEKETAIAEVRPWIGSRVSVSQFRTTRELRGLDLTQEFGKTRIPPFSAKEGKFLPVSDEEKETAAWTHIDNAFSQPVDRTDDPTEYVPTQILAELFRDNGYEAIVYRSLLGKKGFNVVIFDIVDADPVDGLPCEVKKIDVAFEAAGYAW